MPNLLRQTVTVSKTLKSLNELQNSNNPKKWALSYLKAHGRDNCIRMVDTTLKLLINNQYTDKSVINFYKNALVYLKQYKGE